MISIGQSFLSKAGKKKDQLENSEKPEASMRGPEKKSCLSRQC